MDEENNEGKRVALIPMSAKPLHAGHDRLIQLALKECDQVSVLISLTDRENVPGSTMKRIWDEVVRPQYPTITLQMMNSSPITAAYSMMGIADVHHRVLKDTFVIYGDETDLASNFPEKSLIKYVGNLYNQKRVILRSVSRSETLQLSGTQMRQWLREGDKKNFIAGLPEWMEGEAVWQLLND